MMRQSLAPRARAASANSLSRAASTWPRTRRISDPSAEGERKNQVEDAGAAEGDEGDGKNNSGKRQEHVHQEDVDKAVDASAILVGQPHFDHVI
jgi:hypothetical protein